jgi:uncharacterized membrane protein
MSLEKKLASWRAAGLIDEATRERIAAFEARRAQPILLYTLGGLGALTIGIGLVSIVAANWAAISKVAKLSLDLLVGGGLAGALFFVVATRRAWQVELLAVIYWLYVIASIALLGQVYQLGSPEYQALLVWTVATAPMMCLVRSRFVGMAWLAGIVSSHVVSLVYVFEQIDRVAGDVFLANVVASSTVASFVAYMMIARLPWFVRERWVVSIAWSEALWSGWLGCARGVGFLWYVSSGAVRLSWGGGVCAALVVGLHFRLPHLYPELSPRARMGMSMMLAASWAALVSATSFERAAWPAIGAIEQVALLGIAAWAVAQTGKLHIFNVLTGVVAARILAMYFEVFGSMLDTGLGMIGGGLLTLLLAWVWKRKSPELANRLVHSGVPHAS